MIKRWLKWHDKWEGVVDMALITILVIYGFTNPVLKWATASMFGATFLYRFCRTARQKAK